MAEIEKTLHNPSFLSGPVPYPMIEMVWADASGDNGWDQGDKDYEETLCLTVGFLVHHDDKHVVVASTIHNGDYGTNARVVIPIGMIRYIKDL